MDFRTGLSQVVGNERVTGVGFMVSATGRFKNTKTGVVSSGYLAPFVQLRLTLIDLKGPRVVHSTTLSEGFVVGSKEAEGSEPWLFLSRQEKARALRDLMRRPQPQSPQQAGCTTHPIEQGWGPAARPNAQS